MGAESALFTRLMPNVNAWAIATVSATMVAWPGVLPGVEVGLRVQLPDAPESVTIGPAGRLFATLYEDAAVVEILPSGTFRTVATLPGQRNRVMGHALGIATGPDGKLYVAYRQRSSRDADDFRDPDHPACRDATILHSGVYRVDPDSGAVEVLASRADGWPVCFPNGIAVDARGDVYVADFTYAGIWRLRVGEAPELWTDHPLLNWAPAPWSLAPFGVNAIALDTGGRAIIAGTVGTPRVLRIHIGTDGRASEPEIIQSDGGPTDGIAVASDGTVFTSEIARSEIWALSADGSQRYLVADSRNAPLDGNAGLAISDQMLCVANLGFPKANRAIKDRTVVCFNGVRPVWHKGSHSTPANRP